MNVFVAGCAAHLAAGLLPVLCNDERIEKVTGIDIRGSRFSHPKFSFHQMDIRDPRVVDLLRNHDALINLAFVVLRGRRKETDMRDINVDGCFALFKQANALGVRRLIHLSSASVYGNGENLAEDSPLDPIAGFVYAEHKTELERKLSENFPQVLCLRPHIILGPHALPLLKRILKLPFYIKLDDPQPLLQCVHETDVIYAIHLALFASVSGPLNLAASDGISFREMIEMRSPNAIGVPLQLALFALQVVWKLSGWGGEPAWLQGAQYSLTLNCDKAWRELNWCPAYTSREAINES